MFPIGNYVDKCFVLTLTNHSNMSAFWYYDEESYVENFAVFVCVSVFGIINKKGKFKVCMIQIGSTQIHFRTVDDLPDLALFHVGNVVPMSKICRDQGWLLLR